LQTIPRKTKHPSKTIKDPGKDIAKESAHMDLEHEDLVRKIVSDWISRKS